MPKISPHMVDYNDWDTIEEQLEEAAERERRRLRNHELRQRPETKPPSLLHQQRRRHEEPD